MTKRGDAVNRMQWDILSFSYQMICVPLRKRGNEMLVVRVELIDPTVKWSKGTENAAQNQLFAS